MIEDDSKTFSKGDSSTTVKPGEPACPILDAMMVKAIFKLNSYFTNNIEPKKTRIYDLCSSIEKTSLFLRFNDMRDDFVLKYYQEFYKEMRKHSISALPWNGNDWMNQNCVVPEFTELRDALERERPFEDNPIYEDSNAGFPQALMNRKLPDTAVAYHTSQRFKEYSGLNKFALNDLI